MRVASFDRITHAQSRVRPFDYNSGDLLWENAK